MSYHFSKTVSMSFEDAITEVTEALQKRGFGVLTEIDVKATLKKKLDVDFRNYRILGACNPAFAHQALQMEENIGLLMPCNVVVQEKDDGTVQVSAVNPMETMAAVGNEDLAGLATEVQAKLEDVIASL